MVVDMETEDGLKRRAVMVVAKKISSEFFSRKETLEEALFTP